MKIVCGPEATSKLQLGPRFFSSEEKAFLTNN